MYKKLIRLLTKKKLGGGGVVWEKKKKWKQRQGQMKNLNSKKRKIDSKNNATLIRYISIDTKLTWSCL